MTLRQTSMVFAIEIEPERLAFARAAGGRFSWAALAPIPGLHFLSVVIFEDPFYDPLLVIAAEVDGGPAPFLALLVQAEGACLLDVLRHTRPRRESGFSGPPQGEGEVAAYLAGHQVKIGARHRGHRGLAVGRVRAEAAIAAQARAKLDMAPIDQRQTLAAVHNLLQPLAPQDWPPRDPWWLRWLPLRPPYWPFALAGVAVLAAAIWGILAWRGLPTTLCALLIEILAILLMLILPPLALYAGIQRLDRSDAEQTRPEVPDALEHALRAQDPAVQREEAQNFLASIVHVKPGARRSIAVRLVLLALGVKIGLFNRDGYLGNMRTIHVAHWSLIGNGGRLLFLSHFDGSWDSYLNDFVEKAAFGLTLAWSNCVGFPVVGKGFSGGAAAGRQFKRWARRSQSPPLFVYRAYPQLTVDRIERNHAIAAGLRAGTADAAWATLL